MSVKDINLVINLYSALTGELYFNIKRDDYLYNGYARDYFNSKVQELIEEDKGAIIKSGYKN